VEQHIYFALRADDGRNCERKKTDPLLATAIWDGASFDEWSTDFAKAIVCMILAGPLLTGYTQVLAKILIHMKLSLPRPSPLFSRLTSADYQRLVRS
jgi:hypothetical protein